MTGTEYRITCGDCALDVPTEDEIEAVRIANGHEVVTGHPFLSINVYPLSLSRES